MTPNGNLNRITRVLPCQSQIETARCREHGTGGAVHVVEKHVPRHNTSNAIS